MAHKGTRSLVAAASLCATLAAHGNTTAPPLTAAQTQKMSLMVVDTNCSTVVEPFKLTDNLDELFKRTIVKTVNQIKDRLLNRGATPDVSQLSEQARIEAKRLNWMPMNLEVMYGEKLHAQETLILERDKPDGKKYYPIADQILEDVKKGVGAPHDYDFKLFILKQATRNALARPGGYLYLDAGLLKDPKQLDKAYFAVAHEVAHVLKRHETRELQGLIIDSFETAEDLKLIANATRDPEAILAKVKLNKDQYTRHHMDQELQADACAARVLGDAYLDDPKLARTIRAFLKELVPPTPEEMEEEAKAVALKQEQAAKVAAAEAAAQAPGAKKPRKKDDKEKAEDALGATALAYQVAASPATRHPNSKERTENLDAMYRELTAKQPTKTAVKSP